MRIKAKKRDANLAVIDELDELHQSRSLHLLEDDLSNADPSEDGVEDGAACRDHAPVTRDPEGVDDEDEIAEESLLAQPVQTWRLRRLTFFT